MKLLDKLKMAEVQIVDTTDELSDAENSSQDKNIELDKSDGYIHMQQLLPSRCQVKNEKYEMMDSAASILPYATLRTRQMSRLPMEIHANAITSHLQLNKNLVGDDPRSHRLRIETLKSMPQCLTIKRSVKSKLEETIAQKPKVTTLSNWKWLKYRMSYTFTKIRTMRRDIRPSLELWYCAIKLIEGQSGSGIAAYFKFLRWLICLNTLSCILSVAFVVLPQSLKQTYLQTDLSIWDFFTGSGFFSNTIMYYGFYSNSTVEQIPETVYNIPVAYFMTLLCSYIFTLIILCIKVASSYRKCYIEIGGKVQNMYSNKIFCGWDFSISSSKAASLHSAAIHRELEELLAEAKQQLRPTCFEKMIAIICQVIVTIVVLAMKCGAAVLLWTLLSKHETDTYNPISVLVLPTAVTIIMHIFPAIIAWLALLENYTNKRTELYVTVIRIHAMAATVIGTHLAFWLTNKDTKLTSCWQTKLGEEIYRLILLDFIAAIFGTCILDYSRSMFHDWGWKRIRKSEFHIARSTLNLIYNQTLFWLGFYFSPFMSVIILVKMILIFYMKKHGLLKYYKPPSRPWRAAQMETLFLALAFLGMIGILMVLGYTIANMGSNDCGPFRGHETAWDYVIDDILSLKKDSTIWKIMSELTSPGVGAVILISMCVAAYCLRAKVEASKEMLQILKEMMVLQTRDKEFLMRSLSTFGNKHHVLDHNMTCSTKDFITKHARFNISTDENDDCDQETRRRNTPSGSRSQENFV